MQQNIDILKKKKILLLGDFLLDSFLFGTCNRLSPEAPVPIINYENEEINLGGAGNVLVNLINLGVKVTPVSILGKDQTSREILKLLKNLKVNTSNIIIDKNYEGILKKRLVIKNQHVARIDYEKIDLEICKKYKKKIKKNLEKIIFKSDLIVLSDYGKGFLIKEITQFVIRLANKLKIDTIVDPRKMSNDYSIYNYCTYITPNLNELRNIFPFIKNTNKDVNNASSKLLKKFKFKNVLVTRGEMGISLFNKKVIKNFKSSAKEVFDVSGAGDTVVAVLAACILMKKNLIDSIKISNLCAGYVISLRGTKPINLIKFKEFYK